MLTLFYDSYFGDWIVKDQRIWYKTKHWTFLSLKEAEEWLYKELKQCQ